MLASLTGTMCKHQLEWSTVCVVYMYISMSRAYIAFLIAYAQCLVPCLVLSAYLGIFLSALVQTT